MKAGTSPNYDDFGENIFSLEQMAQHLPAGTYRKLLTAIQNHCPITRETADIIAEAMKQWALNKGATHYTHWFQPLTGCTAEKHQTFLDFDSEGKPIAQFAGRELITGEPDASSFPHGGLRSTFEARGYTAWDPTSPAFLVSRENCNVLCLPSIFISYTGEVLDKKTPLIRSAAAIDKASTRMMRLLGSRRTTSAEPYVGAEQEYFLVDRKLFLERPDLREVEATLLGTAPARGQDLDRHYFRSIHERALSFMEEVESELLKLGILAKTRHNEVAPCQFEFAMIHRPANIAADQNQMIMESLRRVAPRHDLEVLLHEKPFAGINGSGKHNNWSIIDADGTNLLSPGTKPASQIRFLVFVLAVLKGVNDHRELLHSITLSPGNELRLGGSEAPPAIISVHLGDHLSRLLDELVNRPDTKLNQIEELDLATGVGGIARIPKDSTDRNRTAPIAFTGNKFEFRMVGSSASISLPNIVICAAVAEALNQMADQIEQLIKSGETRPAAILKIMQQTIRETESCRFDGNCYSSEWSDEARRRGLELPSTTPEALRGLISPKSLALFSKLGILTEEEVQARYQIRLENYVENLAAELSVLRQILKTQILPAVLKAQDQIASGINSVSKALAGDSGSLEKQRRHLSHITMLIDELLGHIETLDHDTDKVSGITDIAEQAAYYATEIRPNMATTRLTADALEDQVPADLWPLPKYNQLLKL
jgi:glutamine synthetase